MQNRKGLDSPKGGAWRKAPVDWLGAGEISLEETVSLLHGELNGAARSGAAFEAVAHIEGLFRGYLEFDGPEAFAGICKRQDAVGLLASTEKALIDACYGGAEANPGRTGASNADAACIAQRLSSYLAIAAALTGDEAGFESRLERALYAAIQNTASLSALVRESGIPEADFGPFVSCPGYWTEPLDIIAEMFVRIGHDEAIKNSYGRYSAFLEGCPEPVRGFLRSQVEGDLEELAFEKHETYRPTSGEERSSAVKADAGDWTAAKRSWRNPPVDASSKIREGKAGEGSDEMETEKSKEMLRELRENPLFGTPYKYERRLVFGRYHGQPITWLALAVEGGALLAVSEHVLDWQPWSDDPLPDSGYDDSLMRAWLEEEFLYDAFDGAERSRIESVGCLSAEQARALFPDDAARIAYPTAYGAAAGAPFSGEGGSPWWTSDVTACDCVVFIRADGGVYLPGKSGENLCGVRPALRLSLEGALGIVRRAASDGAGRHREGKEQG